MTLISFASVWKLLIPWQGSKLNYIVITQRSKTEMKMAFKNSGCLVFYSQTFMPNFRIALE